VPISLSYTTPAQDENYTLSDTVFAKFDTAGQAALSDCSHCNFPNTQNHGAKRNQFERLSFVDTTIKVIQGGFRVL
jgi:hypothetical protein